MLTQERLKELVVYDPETGVFLAAKNRKGSRNKQGMQLGTIDKKGYIQIQLDGKRYFGQRLAVLYMTGSFPENVVDHINRITSDNRWCNLRQVTQVENTHNQNRKPENNSLGCVGVHRYFGKYRAKLVLNKKQIHLGTFGNLEDASMAYQQAKNKLQPAVGY